jgi:ElaB/YqjD/DUF883 family membrane-anchored ribosome-binding protein
VITTKVKAAVFNEPSLKSAEINVETFFRLKQCTLWSIEPNIRRCVRTWKQHLPDSTKRKENKMAMTEPGAPTQGEHPGAIKEKFVDDLRTLASDTEELLRATANQTGEQIGVARSKAQESLLAAKARLAEAQAALGEKARATAKTADAYARQNPWQVAGIAAATALIIGMLIARR